ncbi:MAG TPA: FeoA family protein [Vicinamibacterales bacterium]|nr:FeoA family protein [Vicinamibacterales bacterium]
MPGASHVRLSDLSEGDSATFDHAEVDASTARLLSALGFTATCRLLLCKTGEPFIVKVRDTRVGLSRALAGAIVVTPLANGPA